MVFLAIAGLVLGCTMFTVGLLYCGDCLKPRDTSVTPEEMIQALSETY